MFRKKKKIVEPVKFSYKEWNDDFGFLNLIINRKKNINREFILHLYNDQKNEKDLLSDEEIEPVINSIVNEIIFQIGDNYKKFLVEKYFGSDNALIQFITEDIYTSVLNSAISNNLEKIKAVFNKRQLDKLSNLNRNN